MGSAFGWTVYATMLTLLLAVIGLLANQSLRLETKIDAVARDLRAEMREGFAQIDGRLRLLERDRS